MPPDARALSAGAKFHRKCRQLGPDRHLTRLAGMCERDADSVMMRLLCEKAEERLEQAWTASEIAHRTIQLPDGSYYWAKEDAPLQLR